MKGSGHIRKGRLVSALLLLWVAAPSSAEGAAPKPSSASSANASQLADAKRRAAALLNEGNARFKEHDFAGALYKYESAYQTYPSAKILLNLAEALSELGRADEAATAYERFIKEAAVDTQSKIGRQVQKRLKTLEPKLAYLAIESQTSGPAVTIDGQSAGKLPIARVRVSPGPHAVSARLAGYEQFWAEVEASAGRTVQVRVTMVPTSIPPREEPIAKAGAPLDLGVKPAPAPQPAMTVSTEGSSEPVTTRWWFWTAIGVAAAAAVTVAVVTIPHGNDFRPSGELGTSGTSQWTRF